jgi:hypothetical protein
MHLMRALLLVLLALVGSLPADAQVVREEGVKSIAGVLGGAYPGDAHWIIGSSGNEVIFASLDAEIYRTAGQHEDAAEPHDSAEGGGGCADEGGPGRFCMQVIDATGAVICQATRPAPPPGWQRDPRLACVLPHSAGQAAYAIRVSLAGPEGSCTQPSQSLASAKPHPFVLNVSVRRVPASGLSLEQAVATSTNRFGASGCVGSAPGIEWVCQEGNWLPPNSPLLWGGPTTPPSTPLPCGGTTPAFGWVCQDGNWLPPDHPLIRR